MMIRKGTLFQKKVWNEVKKIPVGEVRSYKQIAISIGCPNSYRAVGNACAKNSNPQKIPCHRVIRTNNDLGGYSIKGGKIKKKEILKSEGFKFDKQLRFKIRHY